MNPPSKSSASSLHRVASSSPTLEVHPKIVVSKSKFITLAGNACDQGFGGGTAASARLRHIVQTLTGWMYYGSGVGFGLVFAHEMMGVPRGVPVISDEASQLILPLLLMLELNSTDDKLPIDTSLGGLLMNVN